MTFPEVPLRQVCISVKDGTHGSFSRVTDGVPFLSAKNVQDGHLLIEDDESTISWADYAEISRYGAFRRGDVLLTIVGSIGRVAVLETDTPLAFQRSVASLRVNSQMLSRFLHWALRSATVQGGLMLRARQAAQAGVYLGDVAEVTVPLPPLDEQRRIVDFLDAETARIDRLIELRGSQISLAEEKVTAEGRHLLLDAADPLKAGVPLRRLVARIQTGGTPREEESWLWTEGNEGSLPWYSPGDFGSSLHLTSSEKRVRNEAATARLLPIFPANSVLVVGIGATAGRVALLDHPATGNQQLTAMTPNVDVSAQYLAWCLWVRRDLLRALAPFTTLPILNNDFLRSVRVPMLDEPQQGQLVTRLDRLAEHCLRHVKLLKSSRALLVERRTAIITAAVTGQLDVATARGAA